MNRRTPPHGRAARVHRLLFVLVGLCGGQPSTLLAQETIPASRTSSPSFAAEHWAVEAAARAEALGLVDRYLPAQRAVPRHVVGEVLRKSATRAAESFPHLVELTAAWETRFQAEFAGARPLIPDLAFTSLGNVARLGFVAHTGRAATGTGIFPDSRTGATALLDLTEARGGVSIAAGIGPNAAFTLEPGFRGSTLAMERWDATLGVRSVALSVGRQAVGYGYAATPIVLSGAAVLSRVQLETVQPVRLPGVFSRLGLISLHTFGSRLREPRHPGDPYLWGASGSLQPHPRVTFSLHRASILGGDSVDIPITPRNLFRTFIGHNLLNFENEVFAGQLRFRLPTESLLPITVYTEWGAEDAAGAWRDVPGRLAGVFVPALPGLPAAAVGVEYASFAVSCCGNPPWYRHAQHHGGWAEADLPLGHALGGQGEQWLAYAQLDLWRTDIRLEAQVFGRERRIENLFVPGRDGSSHGGTMQVVWRGRPDLEVGMRASLEHGGDWRERVFEASVQAYF